MNALTTESSKLSIEAQAEFDQLLKELETRREDSKMLEYMFPGIGDLHDANFILGLSWSCYSKDPRYLEEPENEEQGELMYDLLIRLNRVGKYCHTRFQE